MFTPILIGTTGDYPPFSQRRADGSFCGFDIDLINLLISNPKTFVPLRWGNLETSLKSRAVDCIASGITVTSTRKGFALFSQPYFINHTVVVSHRDRQHAILRLGVNAGGYLETVARAKFPELEIIPIKKNELLPQALLAGEFDAFLSDTIEAERICANYPLSINQQLDRQEQGIMVRNDLIGLKQEIDGALTRLLHSGGLQQLAAEHGIDSQHIPVIG